VKSSGNGQGGKLQKPVRNKKYKIYISVILCSLVVLVFILLSKPLNHLINSGKNLTNYQFEVKEGFADDLSRLNLCKVDSVADIAGDSAAMVSQLRDLLVYARVNQLKVAVAGAKHSMGGHTIAPDGIRINMLPFSKLSLDTASWILTAGSGALWSDIIPYLNRYGRAVHIMQSDNAFSVGGSVSVNCHGWQHNQPPIASSVLSFRLMRDDGKIVTCSRETNRDLFSLVLGGYGLFGIILDVKLRTVPNELYTFHRMSFNSENYTEYYNQYVNKNEKARMVYGRLNVNKKHFLEKAMLNYFEAESIASAGYPIPEPGFTSLKQKIFEGTRDDDYGKEFRWKSEKLFTKSQIGNLYSRNEIMNESPAFYLNKDTLRTDILHEYFIPVRNFNKFINQLKEIVPRHKADLLNVTIRNVYEDKDTYLRYAKEEVFAFVMFFNQPRTSEAEADMAALTQKLIIAAGELDGVYYLPYRLHASKEQFLQSYPMAREFFRKKNEYDPDEIFGNMFWEKYK
jgi:FAD/FMN-containing dehydrogenase